MKIGTAALVAFGLLTGGVAIAQDRPDERSRGGMHKGGMMEEGMMDEGMMGMMSQCARMMDAMDADVSVENTPDGAVIRLSARDPSDVEAVQERARMMGRCCPMNDDEEKTNGPQPRSP